MVRERRFSTPTSLSGDRQDLWATADALSRKARAYPSARKADGDPKGGIRRGKPAASWLTARAANPRSGNFAIAGHSISRKLMQ